MEVTTCLRRSELEVDLRPWPGAEPVADELHAELAAPHARQLISDDGTSSDERLAGRCCARLDGGHRRIVPRAAAGGSAAGGPGGSSAYVAGGVVAYSNEARRRCSGYRPR